MYLLIIFLIPKLIFSLELNLVCTNNNAIINKVDVKDVFLLLNTENKKVDLGGLSFEADNISVTKSNISWFSNNVELYPESNGSVSGILGRYSGELVLHFKRDDNDKADSLIFNCRKFAIKDRKF
jgi:hypothetical protein